MELILVRKAELLLGIELPLLEQVLLSSALMEKKVTLLPGGPIFQSHFAHRELTDFKAVLTHAE